MRCVKPGTSAASSQRDDWCGFANGLGFNAPIVPPGLPHAGRIGLRSSVFSSMSRGRLFHVVSALWLTSRVRFSAIRDGKSQPRWHPRALLLPRSTAACTGDRKHDRGRQADRPKAPRAIGRGACRVRSRPSSSAMPVASIRGAPPDGHLLRTPCQTKNWTTPVATAGANGIPRNLGLSGVDMDVDRHSPTARLPSKSKGRGRVRAGTASTSWTLHICKDQIGRRVRRFFSTKAMTCLAASRSSSARKEGPTGSFDDRGSAFRGLRNSCC